MPEETPSLRLLKEILNISSNCTAAFINNLTTQITLLPATLEDPQSQQIILLTLTALQNLDSDTEEDFVGSMPQVTNIQDLLLQTLMNQIFTLDAHLQEPLILAFLSESSPILSQILIQELNATVTTQQDDVPIIDPWCAYFKDNIGIDFL